MTEPDWPSIRAEFPALAAWTYLNTAAFGQIPLRARTAVDRHFAHRDERACSDFIRWFDDADRIRASAARLIHCAPEDIAFIPNASTALSLFLGGLQWKTGDRIVTFTGEFPNHFYYAGYLAREGVELVETDYDGLESALTPRTRAVLVSTVNYTTGFRAPLEKLAPVLLRRGILLYVDGTQSAGALRFDARAIRPDMFAVDAYKWLISPNGAGFMFVHPELRERLAPAVIGWRSDLGWRNHEALHHGAPRFKTGAERYEGGMLPFALLYAMEAAMEMMHDIGPARIEERVLALAERVCTVLERRGGRVLHRGSPIVAAHFDSIDASELAGRLERENVLVSARHGNLRVSPHFYNDESDVDRLEECLR